MASSILLATLLALVTNVQSQNYGPYHYPNGSSNDSIFITMGSHNSTHFYINLHVIGDHWFGFALPDDCSPASGCTGDLKPSGCVTPNTALSGCKMDQSDAIIFGNYGGTQIKVTALEWTLGDHSSGFLHANQNSVGIYYLEHFAWINPYYSASITRPYDPSKYGDRSSHKITYPFAGSFCWLWAIGNGIYFSPASSHQYAGYQCIDFGGDTDDPTPSPTYGPTHKPTADPTKKPSKMPSKAGETAQPTPDPTKEPSISPTEVSANPSVAPSRVPTPGPTVLKGEPTNSPTKKPTPGPTLKPTVSPTPEPTDAPLEPGQTKSPSINPTPGPTTYQPTPAPTYKPTPSPTFIEIVDDDVTSDTSWLEENLTWILSVGIIAAIVCFCSACFCFWCKQKRRTEKRRERRQNLLEAERFKIEHGLNIDADNRSKRNRAIAQRMTAKNQRRSGSGSGLRYGYGDDGGSTTEESDEFFLDDMEYGHGGTRDKYRSRTGNGNGNGIDHDDDDEKAEIYVTSGGTQGGRNLNSTRNGDVDGFGGGRKKKYKPNGGGRRNKGRSRTKGGMERKSKFVQNGLDQDTETVSVRRPRKKYNSNAMSSSDSSD